MRPLFYFLLLLNWSIVNAQTQTIDHAKVGSIAANAKYMDVDNLSPFNRGAAVLNKGHAFCIVDGSFNMIVPFNKYEFITSYGSSGLFSGTAKFKPADLLNSKGRVVHSYRGDNPRVENWPDGFAWIGEDKHSVSAIPGQITCVNAKGKKITIKTTGAEEFDEWHEGIVRFKTDKGYGYMDSNCKVIIPPQYESGKEFSQGLAAVAKRDAFGEVKWGFIDKAGKVVIPFQYSMAPSSFGSGLTAIVPKNATGIKFWLVNQNGEIVLSAPLSAKAEVNTDKKFVGGFMRASLLGGCDILGQEYSYKTMFAQAGLPARNMTYPDWSVEDPLQDGQIIFTRRGKEGGMTKGILDIDHETFINPIFEELSLFDPVSNLAYAKLQTGKDNNGFPAYREGYINRQGIFVFVKQAKSNW